MTALKERRELPQVHLVPGKPWSFLVDSRSRSGVKHLVEVDPTTLSPRCECESSEFRPSVDCIHRQAVNALVKAQQGFNEVTQPTPIRHRERAPEAMNIEEAMAAIYGSVGYVQKDKKIESGPAKYAYAGEAAVIAAVRDAMVENQVTVRIASVRDVIHEEITIGSQGSRMQRTTLIATARFTHGPSRTYIDCEALGEGMDSGDKSSNKAMTGALKYALRQTFCLETGNDPDASRPEYENGNGNGHHDAPEARTPMERARAMLESDPGTISDGIALWNALQKAMTDANLGTRDIAAVFGGKYGKQVMLDYMAANPDATIGTIISRAANAAGGGGK